jgi:hypothetical protein
MTVLVMAATANAQQRYGWTVSQSPSDPCVNEGAFAAGGLVTLFLFYTYNSPDGMSAADISVVVNPPGALNIFGFNVANGFLNAGTSTNLLLAIGGCPSGPIQAGNWPAFSSVAAWEFCLGGLNSTVNCDPLPVITANDHKGFSNNGFPRSCQVGMNDDCSPIVSVEDASWGSIKSLYR